MNKLLTQLISATSHMTAGTPYNSIIRPQEQFWVDHQPFLLSQGYRLRSRYDPAWKPSWIRTSWPYSSDRFGLISEDGIVIDVSLLPHQGNAFLFIFTE